MTTAPHFLTRLRPVTAQLATAALLVFLPLALATGARAQCVCLGDCTQCIGCSQNYTTPLLACDKCYRGTATGGTLFCSFMGKPVQLPGGDSDSVAFPEVMPSDAQIPSTRFPGTRLPGTKMGTTISPF
jgi:hypothetical protein